jgi:hypothetical protein
LGDVDDDEADVAIEADELEELEAELADLEAEMAGVQEVSMHYLLGRQRRCHSWRETLQPAASTLVLDTKAMWWAPSGSVWHWQLN